MAAGTKILIRGLGPASTVIHSADSGEVWLGARGCLVRMSGESVVETRLLSSPLPGATLADPTLALAQALEQVGQYLQGQRRSFDLKLEMQGPPFFRAAWAALRELPYGQTLSYAELAAKAGRPGSARAVGSAMRKNPIPLIVPCHRVVGSGGKLGGFSGGLEWKRFLLNLERSNTGLEFLA